jgi:hypothetical protein
MAGDDVFLFHGEPEAIAERVARGVDGVANAMTAMAYSRSATLDALRRIAGSPDATLSISLIAEAAIEEAGRRATEVK